MNKNYVTIYDAVGNQADVIFLPERISWVEGRLSISGSGLYYKGAGCPYQWHNSMAFHSFMDFNGEHFYPYGVRIVNPYLKGKHGIFKVNFTEVLNEPVGGCGPRERNLVFNSVSFGKSDVEVINKIDLAGYDCSIYVVTYTSNRIKFTTNPDVSKLLDLIYFMLDSDWNFAWDKHAVADITALGNISDVADLFKSEELIHKIGTVVSIVSSLFIEDPFVYSELRKKIGCDFNFVDFGVLSRVRKQTIDDCILVACSILRSNYGVSIEGPLTAQCFMDFVYNYLLPGINCGISQSVVVCNSVRKAYFDTLLNFNKIYT